MRGCGQSYLAVGEEWLKERVRAERGVEEMNNAQVLDCISYITVSCFLSFQRKLLKKL